MAGTTQTVYSAGAVKHSFWFQEFRKLFTLLSEGCGIDDIKRMSAQENIFAAPTPARAMQIFSAVSVRVRSLDGRFYAIMLSGGIGTQKIVALISMMTTDRLFFDFLYEVYREKLILGDGHLADSDIRIFFQNKQMQDERVANWQDVTLKRLGVCYKTYMVESGIASRDSNGLRIEKPVLDAELVHCLIDCDMVPYLNALTGVR